MTFSTITKLPSAIPRVEKEYHVVMATIYPTQGIKRRLHQFSAPLFDAAFGAVRRAIHILSPLTMVWAGATLVSPQERVSSRLKYLHVIGIGAAHRVARCVYQMFPVRNS